MDFDERARHDWATESPAAGRAEEALEKVPVPSGPAPDADPTDESAGDDIEPPLAAAQNKNVGVNVVL